MSASCDLSAARRALISPTPTGALTEVEDASRPAPPLPPADKIVPPVVVSSFPALPFAPVLAALEDDDDDDDEDDNNEDGEEDAA